MLHEVLLALSGHPSPLFSQDQREDGRSGSIDFPMLSTSERALLKSLGDLSELHRKLRRHVKVVASTHKSIICRAVATSIQQMHLFRFQKKILDVERSLLTKDASVVRAYEIVPLAGVVSSFDDWHRRMVWCWEIACFMLRPGNNETIREHDKGCSGANVIDKLRAESCTGFPEIADAARELTVVAETAWLRQLASWVLYGKLPSHGALDFFVQQAAAPENGAPNLRKDKDLMPAFVSSSAATSMLFIGRSLQQIGELKKRQHLSASRDGRVDEAELVSTHVQHLSALSLPIVPAQLSRAILAIRKSLSHNALQHLLPIGLTLQVLSCLRHYFLLAKGEFAMALIDQAEGRLQARQQNMGRLLQQDPLKAIQGLSIKDTELHQTLMQTWKSLARDDMDAEDETLEFARSHITIQTQRMMKPLPSVSEAGREAAPQMSTVAFNDLLFPTATSLYLSVEPPLDLFISPVEIDAYSCINSYLLAIRRADARLSELWRRSAARRDYASPSSRSRGGPEHSQARKAMATRRRQETRKIWATCSAALFLISETAAYFEGEVVKSSCDHLERWIQAPNTANTLKDEGGGSDSTAQRDPESLGQVHHAFLVSLTYALLLTDTPYTRELRSLLGNIDVLIAYFNRLLDLQGKLDLEHDAGAESSLTVEDEPRIALELDRARKKVDSDLRSVVNRLRQVDQERMGSARYLDMGAIETGGFEPWKGGGVDRLLMKLEFGRMLEPGYDII